MTTIRMRGSNFCNSAACKRATDQARHAYPGDLHPLQAGGAWSTQGLPRTPVAPQHCNS